VLRYKHLVTFWTYKRPHIIIHYHKNGQYYTYYYYYYYYKWICLTKFLNNKRHWTHYDLFCVYLVRHASVNLFLEYTVQMAPKHVVLKHSNKSIDQSLSPSLFLCVGRHVVWMVLCVSLTLKRPTNLYAYIYIYIYSSPVRQSQVDVCTRIYLRAVYRVHRVAL